MKRPKKDKGLVQELDELLMYAERIYKETVALAKEDRNLKKLKAELKRALKTGK
jgi:hypothetical protein